MAIKATEIVEWCEKSIRQKKVWLEDHGRRARKPRPEMEIETKEHDIDVLYAILDDYKAAIEARKNRG